MSESFSRSASCRVRKAMGLVTNLNPKGEETNPRSNCTWLGTLARGKTAPELHFQHQPLAQDLFPLLHCCREVLAHLVPRGEPPSRATSAISAETSTYHCQRRSSHQRGR